MKKQDKSNLLQELALFRTYSLANYNNTPRPNSRRRALVGPLV